MLLILAAVQHALTAAAGTAFAVILIRRYCLAKWPQLSAVFADDPTVFLLAVGCTSFLLAVLLAVVV